MDIKEKEMNKSPKKIEDVKSGISYTSTLYSACSYV